MIPIVLPGIVGVINVAQRVTASLVYVLRHQGALFAEVLANMTLPSRPICTTNNKEESHENARDCREHDHRGDHLGPEHGLSRECSEEPKGDSDRDGRAHRQQSRFLRENLALMQLIPLLLTKVYQMT